MLPNELQFALNSVLILGIAYLVTNYSTSYDSEMGIFTPEELAEYNGITKKPLYLAVTGIVFDVTKGKQHYEKGASYHYFIGKDGSKSLVTGNFSDESTDKDHVLSLNCRDIIIIKNWETTFKKKYTYKGKLIGRYFDRYGLTTAYSKALTSRREQCEKEEKLKADEKKKYPPCNMKWSENEGSTVWCSNNSGGIPRAWAGVPRRMYMPGEVLPNCVCINLADNNHNLLIKEYKNCEPLSSICKVVENND